MTPLPPDAMSTPLPYTGSPYGDLTAHVALRDFFAGQALAGMNLVTLSQGLTSHPYHPFKDAARNAYLYADAMIEARSAPTTPKQA